jgi:hypothetical protein
VVLAKLGWIFGLIGSSWWKVAPLTAYDGMAQAGTAVARNAANISAADR